MKGPVRTLILAVFAALLPPAVVAAAPPALEGVTLSQSQGAWSEPKGAQCPGATRLDDGTFEDGAGWPNRRIVGGAHVYVQGFDLPGGRKTLETVCLCWTRTGSDPTVDVELVAFAADGKDGLPGTFLGHLESGRISPPLSPQSAFFAFDAGGLEVAGARVFVGAAWTPADAPGFFLCGDTSNGAQAAIYSSPLEVNTSTSVWALSSGLGPPALDLVDLGRGISAWKLVTDFRALGIRPVFTGGGGGPGDGDPPHPSAQPLTTPQLPGFRFWVRIGEGGAARLGTVADSLCAAETLCVAGALPARSEVEIRIVGPKPNGFLWPTIVKFTTSRVEVWIEQVSTGQVQYYLLEGAAPGVDVLPGLFDREGFLP